MSKDQNHVEKDIKRKLQIIIPQKYKSENSRQILANQIQQYKIKDNMIKGDLFQKCKIGYI